MQVWLQKLPKLDKVRYKLETFTDFNKNFRADETFNALPENTVVDLRLQL